MPCREVAQDAPKSLRQGSCFRERGDPGLAWGLGPGSLQPGLYRRYRGGKREPAPSAPSTPEPGAVVSGQAEERVGPHVTQAFGNCCETLRARPATHRARARGTRVPRRRSAPWRRPAPAAPGSGLGRQRPFLRSGERGAGMPWAVAGQGHAPGREEAPKARLGAAQGRGSWQAGAAPWRAGPHHLLEGD